jgi:predicted Holliday junction resolvase-like endonuclease
MHDPTQNPATTTIVVLSLLLIATVAAFIILWRRYEKLLMGRDDSIREARKESVSHSRNALKGRIAEQMAPLLPGFGYLPADCRFLGNPIDYVVFNGHTEFSDPEGSDEDLEIVLLEIKQNSSQLSRVQRAVRRAAEEGRVRFEVARVDEDGNVTIDQPGPGRGKTRVDL